MKTLFLFFLTCIISTGAFLAGTNMSSPNLAFIVGFGIWLLFINWIGKNKP